MKQNREEKKYNEMKKKNRKAIKNEEDFWIKAI